MVLKTLGGEKRCSFRIYLRYVVQHVRLICWTNIHTCGQDRHKTQRRGRGRANAIHKEDMCFKCFRPFLRLSASLSRTWLPDLTFHHSPEMRPASFPALQDASHHARSIVRSSHLLEACVEGLTASPMCTNVRSGPLGSTQFRGRVSG